MITFHRAKEIFLYEYRRLFTTTTIKFSFNRNKARAGVCLYDPLEIQLSEYYLMAPQTTEYDVRNTILHELAHAMVGHEAKHGPEWKRVARMIGCNAERCTKPFMASKDYKYKLVCPDGCKMLRNMIYRNKTYVCRKHRKLYKIKDNKE